MKYCSKLTLKTPERHQWLLICLTPFSSVSIVNCKQVIVCTHHSKTVICVVNQLMVEIFPINRFNGLKKAGGVLSFFSLWEVLLLLITVMSLPLGNILQMQFFGKLYVNCWYGFPHLFKGRNTYDVHENCPIFKTSPPPLSSYVQNSSPPWPSTTPQAHTHTHTHTTHSPNDKQSVKTEHNPRMTIACYQVFPSGRLLFLVSTH